MQVLEHELKKLSTLPKDEDDSDDDDLDDTEGLKAELEELRRKNQERQAKLEEYEKNKKWNVDNMFAVKEERTVVSSAKSNYTDTGFVKPQPDKPAKDTKELKKAAAKPAPAKAEPKKAEPKPAPTDTPTPATAAPPPADVGAMGTYHEFTENYSDLVEQFMALPDLRASKEFLLKYGDVLLQENASNYLLLASLEDEMNGYHEKMKKTARQSQIVTNIAELAKTMQTHPGNVILPFFARLEQREHLDDFVQGCKTFEAKIRERAVVKKKEMDEAAAVDEQGRDLEEVPREQRLGPGGLDPLEVIETLPESMVKAFESRNVDDLRQALMELEPEQAEYHMKRCVDSGLWVA